MINIADEPLNALTVDVEDYFHVAAFSRTIKREDWDGMAPRVENNTRRVLDIFDRAGVRASFFVLGWVAERFPKLVGEIHRRGHEVACHGFSHALIYTQSPDEFRNETIRSKDMLEEITGSPISGYRAASYSITKQSLWALDIILEAGFLYDSSIFPISHDLYGIPDAEVTPYRQVTRGGAEIVEFPPTTFRCMGRNLPVGGGGYFRIYPYSLTRWLLRRINGSQGREFIFYMHPWEIDPDQPRVEAGLRSRFRHYVNLDKFEHRLASLLRDFRFDTALTVLKRGKLL